MNPDGGKQRKPVQTVTGLAANLKLSVDTTCYRTDVACVKNLVSQYQKQKTGKQVLIVWDISELKNIASALGVKDLSCEFEL